MRFEKCKLLNWEVGEKMRECGDYLNDFMIWEEDSVIRISTLYESIKPVRVLTYAISVFWHVGREVTNCADYVVLNAYLISLIHLNLHTPCVYPHLSIIKSHPIHLNHNSQVGVSLSTIVSLSLWLIDPISLAWCPPEH